MFSIIFKKEKIGFVCVDLPGLSRVVGKSRWTVANWFRNGSYFYENESFVICKGVDWVRSNRGLRRAVQKDYPVKDKYAIRKKRIIK